jgi:hypothetical protein
MRCMSPLHHLRVCPLARKVVPSKKMPSPRRSDSTSRKWSFLKLTQIRGTELRQWSAKAAIPADVSRDISGNVAAKGSRRN